MTDVQQPEKQGEDLKDPKDPAEEVFLHLLRHPCDLIDARRLMQRFHASAADFYRALGKFELQDAQIRGGPDVLKSGRVGKVGGLH